MFPVFAALVLVLGISACGKTAPAETQSAAPTEVPPSRTAEGDIASPIEGTRPSSAADEAAAPTDAVTSGTTAADSPAETQGDYGPLFQKYVRERVTDGDYTISMRQSGIAMVTTVSGKDSAVESDMSGVLRIRLVNKDGSYYMLSESTKKYAEMTAEDYAKQADSLQNAALDLSNVRYQSSGTETIGGKTYQTERYDEGERGSVTYFFTDAGLARARVVKNGVTSDIESFTVRDEADTDLLDIPSDYVKVEPAQLFT